jgi:hypothetical protein
MTKGVLRFAFVFRALRLIGYHYVAESEWISHGLLVLLGVIAAFPLSLN